MLLFMQLVWLDNESVWKVSRGELFICLSVAYSEASLEVQQDFELIEKNKQKQ